MRPNSSTNRDRVAATSKQNDPESIRSADSELVQSHIAPAMKEFFGEARDGDQ
jgi:hypothetical protein